MSVNGREIIIGKKYRHFKGNEYLVLHLGQAARNVFGQEGS